MEQTPLDKAEEAAIQSGAISNLDVLDAVKELTKTVAEVVESLNAMRDEYKLKTRAGVFDQTGVK